jgi:hypothetical protein
LKFPASLAFNFSIALCETRKKKFKLCETLATGAKLGLLNPGEKSVKAGEAGHCRAILQTFWRLFFPRLLGIY